MHTPEASEPPITFAFPTAKTEVARMEHMRHNDADLVKAESSLKLEDRYAKARDA